VRYEITVMTMTITNKAKTITALIFFFSPLFLLIEWINVSEHTFDPTSRRKRSPIIRLNSTDVVDVVGKAVNITNDKVEKRRSVIYLHIGPMKTGTTSIQEAMNDKEVVGAAKDDGLTLWRPYTLQHKNLPVFRCFFGRKSRCEPKLRHFFDTKVWAGEHSPSQSDAVFLSHEMLGTRLMEDEIWNMYDRVLKDWDVRIVMGYRRYYNSMISHTNQVFKLRCTVGFVCNEHNETVVDYSFSKEAEKHSPIHSFDFFLARYPKVSIVNLHEEYDIIEHMFCDVVTNFTKVCNAVKSYNNKTSTVIKNKSLYKGFHRIALAAYHAGLVGNQTKLIPLVEYVKRQAQMMEYNETSLPRTCLSKTKLDKILKTSLQYEERVVPEFFRSDLGERALKRDFDEAVREGIFCEVDTAKILADDRWRKVFQDYKKL